MLMMNSVLFLFLFLSFISCNLIELSDINIREHTPIGHLLLTFDTSINRQYSYRFVKNNHREIERYFSLNSSTGELRLAMDIDREFICTHRHVQCKFFLKIFELFQEKLYQIPIIIEDINDNRPIFPYKSSYIEFHLSENSPPYQSKVFIQQAYDRDQRDNQKQLKYRLKNFDQNFPFILEINDESANRVTLVLIRALDRESIESYNCTLYVTDTGGQEEQLHIGIIVDDVNDHSPIFESNVYSIEISENMPINTTILRVHAIDADSGLNGQIVYDFPDASKQFNKIFSIDNETGVIHLRALLDYEQRSSYIFYIEARDSGKEIRSSQTLINITILDENDCYPLITFRFLSELNFNPSKDLIEISENYPVDKFFIHILVTDQDSDLNGRVRLWCEVFDQFNQTNHSFNFYHIDNSTYFLNRTKSFDFEYQQWYYLKFYAQDFHPKNPLQTMNLLTIHILDENDNIPKFLHPFYHLSIYENNPINKIVTKIEAFDADSGENGRITYELQTNETFLPFDINSNTGILRCLQSFDHEKRSSYEFEILARDHGYPLILSSKIPIQIDIKDINDNKPIFEYEKYAFSIEENFNPLKPVGLIRAFDRDLNSHLIYQIDKTDKFTINEKGEIYLRSSIDRESQDKYHFLVTVSDGYFQTSITVDVQILDINDCKPQWKNPSENETKLIVNRDLISIGTRILKLHAIDRDEISNGNGLVSYLIEENYNFLALLNNDELIINSTPIIGHHILKIQAKDNGKLIQHSSLIQINLLIGDNYTNGSLFYDKMNSLSTAKRMILLSTFFISVIFILIFIICLILIMICRHQKQKYLYYIQCKNNHKLPVNIELSSNSSKLSLEDKSSSSPSYTGTHISTPHHQITKPMQTTSDYYSNSSKHEEDIDEWIDTKSSIGKSLYPEWLTMTFTDLNSYQIFETNGKRVISPKHVRFGCQEQIPSYPHLNTTIRQLSTGPMTTISNNDTFI